MKKLLIALIALTSFSIFGSSTYECESVVDEMGKVEIKFETLYFGNLLKEITISSSTDTKLNIKGLKDVDENLLSELSNEDLAKLPLDFVNYANSLKYIMIRHGDLIQNTGYYLSIELLSGFNRGVLMTRNEYSFGPFPRSRILKSFYSCKKLST